jgi:hypothetical protein
LREDGIAEPVRIGQREEPSAKNLMPAVIRTSTVRPELQSLIPPPLNPGNRRRT